MINKKELNKKLLDAISALRKAKSYESFPRLKAILSETEEELKDNEFKITIVGEFSSGKSTFLNALIGKDILPHGVKETTATVTYIHNVPLTDERQNKAVIHFSDQNKEDVTLDVGQDSSALVNYVTTKANEYDVVKDIASVDIFVHFANTEEPIVLIDTPGMNGVAEGHKAITLNEIQHSHASICLFHLRGIGKTDMEFIKDLMKYQETFFFVLNAIDDIKTNEETVQERLQAFHDDIVKYVYENKKEPEYVFGVSSLKALAARDKSISRLYGTDKNDLTEEDRIRISEESEFLKLEDSLYDFLNNSDKEREFYRSICRRLIQTILSCKQAADVNKNILEAKIEDISEKKKIQQLISKADKEFEEIKNNIKFSLTARFEELKKQLYESIRQDIEKEHNALATFVNGLTLEDALKVSDNNIIVKKIENFWSRQVVDLRNDLIDGVGDIQESIVTEMEQVVPSFSIKSKHEIKGVVDATFESFDDSGYQNRLQKLWAERNDYDHRIIETSRLPSSATYESQLSKLEKDAARIRSQHRVQLEKLGSRPSVEYRTESRWVHSRSFLNAISLGLFGSDGYYEDYTVKDDTAQKNWDAKKKKIEKDYNTNLKIKQQQIEIIQVKADEARHNEAMRQIWQNKVKELKRKIEEEERNRQEAINISRTSYRKKLLGELNRIVEEQMALPEGQIYADLTDGVRDNLENCHPNVLKSLHETFDEKKNEYINKLKMMIEKIDGLENVKEKNEQIQLLATDIDIYNNSINNLKLLTNGL